MWRAVIPPTRTDRFTESHEPNVDTQSSFEAITAAPASNVRSREKTCVVKLEGTSFTRIGYRERITSLPITEYSGTVSPLISSCQRKFHKSARTFAVAFLAAAPVTVTGFDILCRRASGGLYSYVDLTGA